MRPICIDRFQHRKRPVRVYLSTLKTCPELRGGPTGILDGVTITDLTRRRRRDGAEIHLNADLTDSALRTTYVHELGHLVLERLGMSETREELIAECVEELSPILRRYALRLPRNRIKAARRRLGVS